MSGRWDSNPPQRTALRGACLLRLFPMLGQFLRRAQVELRSGYLLLLLIGPKAPWSVTQSG